MANEAGMRATREWADPTRGDRRKNDPEVWNKPGWKPLYWALGWTCIGFLVGRPSSSLRAGQR